MGSRFRDPVLPELSEGLVEVLRCGRAPSLSAVAILASREDAIPRLRRFLDHFSMGWRVFDDLSDWERDLSVKNQNRSSVLGYISRINGGRPASRQVVLNSFLSPAFVQSAYGAILGFLSAARDDVSAFHSPYLDQFMDDQLRFHETRRAEILRSGSIMRGSLNRTLRSVS